MGDYIQCANGLYKETDAGILSKVNTFDYPIEKKEKGELKQIAKKAKLATARGAIDFLHCNQSVKDYLFDMKNEWNADFVHAPLLGNARIRFDSDAFRHFYYAKRKPRSCAELTLRAKCLPYIRDILEKSGVKGCCSVNAEGKLSFIIMGRAHIDGKDTAIKIIIAKKKKGKFYYLSVNNLGAI